MTADYCTPIPGGVICGTRMREHSRTSEGIKWCFRCRTRCEMWCVVASPGRRVLLRPDRAHRMRRLSSR